MTTTPEASKRVSRAVAAVVVLATALAVYMGWFVTPLGDIPDETGHYSYVYSVAQGDLLPLLGEAKMVVGLWGDDRHGLAPVERSNYIVQHPPLYYWAAALPHAVADRLGADPGVLYRLPRVVSALAFGGLLLAIFSSLKTAGVAPARALPMVAGLAFLPMLVQLASGTTNDVFLFFLCALATRSMVRFTMQQRLADAYMAAFWLGLAGATKMTAWVFIAPAVAILVYEYRRPLMERLCHGAGVAAVALVLPVAWMLRNWLHFGTPFYREGYDGLSDPLLQAEAVPFTRMLAEEPVMNWLFAHFHGLFGFSGYCQTEGLRHLCDGVEMTQLFGFARNAFTLVVAVVGVIYLVYLFQRITAQWRTSPEDASRLSPTPWRWGVILATLLPGLWIGWGSWSNSMVEFGSARDLGMLMQRIYRLGGTALGLLLGAVVLVAALRGWTRRSGLDATPAWLLLAVVFALGLSGLVHRGLSGQTLGDLQLLVISALPPVGLVAGGLILLQRDPQPRLGLYGPLVLLFFGGILLYQIYQSYLMTGIPRGVQGRYLYPVIPLLMISLGIAIERLRVPPAACLAILVVLGLSFADAFVEQVLPFYLEVRL